jgi:predicted MFS family arabinose efflux permease
MSPPSTPSDRHASSRLRVLLGLPATTYLLALGQAINLTCAVISVTIAALLGSKLVSTPALGTVPYGMQFVAVMLATYPASMLMRRYGRQPVFMAAGDILVLAGIAGFIAAQLSSLTWLISAYVLLGCYTACANFYRFAAVDHIDDAHRASALSLVIAGGVVAAVLGPFLASTLREVTGFAEFALCYAAIALLGVITILIMRLWHPAAISGAQPNATRPGRTPTASLSRPASPHQSRLWLAVFCGAIAYFMMNLLMVQSSLVMKAICSFDDTSHAIQIHVLAMFAPSFVTGALIRQVGLRTVLSCGFVLLLGAARSGTMSPSYREMVVGLMLLGVGWNLLYVGGGTLLSQNLEADQRHRWQGVNDTLIAACATLGAFLPAPLLASVGWKASNGAFVPICVLGILLCVAILRNRGR